MASVVELTENQPVRELARDEVLLEEGAAGGDLHVLLSGELTVERDGVKLATLTQPGTLVGEMSVLLGTRASATVRATRPSRVRTIANAVTALEQDARLAMRIAGIVASRLDATSAVLVDLSKQHEGKPSEQGILARVMDALHVMGEGTADVQRRDLFETSTWPRGPM